MRYESYQYLFPPRPEHKAPPALVQFYQNRGWWGQVKKNGTCTLVFARGLEVIFKTRNPEENEGNHKLWTPLPEHVRFFQSSSTEWNVYVGELIHSKVAEIAKVKDDTRVRDTKQIRNQLYLFDILVSNGHQLVGSTFAQRQTLLRSKLNATSGTDEGDHLRLTPYISLAHNYTSGFQDLWDSLVDRDNKAILPENEGLVFKDPQAKLEPCFRNPNNTAWQAKVRVATKNSGF